MGALRIDETIEAILDADHFPAKHVARRLDHGAHNGVQARCIAPAGEDPDSPDSRQKAESE